MTTPRQIPYGEWPSPIGTTAIVAETVGLSEPRLDVADSYWLEQRSAQGGRSVLVRCAIDGAIADVTPSGYSVRSRVHEYGGGAYVVERGMVFFVNDADQRVYRQDPAAPPRPITPASTRRYADLIVDAPRRRVLAVCEEHGDNTTEPVNTLVALDWLSESANAGGGCTLARGADFHAAPRLSPDGTRLAWLSWDHPDMPWDGTTLRCARIAADGTLADAVQVAGHRGEAVLQPEWSPDGVLHFVSDRSGWWNLYRWRDGVCEPLSTLAADFGAPPWVFGQSSYAFVSADTLICTYTQHGAWRLARLEAATRRLVALDTGYTEFSGLRARAGRVLCCAGAPQRVSAIVQIDPATGQSQILRQASAMELHPDDLAAPQALTYPSANGRAAHALLYLPCNRACRAPSAQRPPLLVRCHGGPTAMAASALNLGIQFWTSRGCAVLDVNYAGSSGYGRAYRELLNGQWGVVDVEDCVAGARYLVAAGLVDGARLAMRGSSAGGYTTLRALTCHDLFKAGASLYGIGDLEALAHDTHKFESRYLERLVGPYPASRDVYRARSPIHHIDRLNAALIVMQGKEDKVVPPDQAERIVAALRTKRLPVAYLLFEHEGHGFRQAPTLRRAFEAELYFYARVFGFTPADALEPVVIDNL